jgi:hypothetical protein
MHGMAAGRRGARLWLGLACLGLAACSGGGREEPPDAAEQFEATQAQIENRAREIEAEAAGDAETRENALDAEIAALRAQREAETEGNTR